MKEVRKILIVDDNTMDVELTISTLAEKNLVNEVIVAEDGEEAIDYLKRQGKYAFYEKGNPAVILLDIKMPGMDGIEVLENIRQDPNLNSIPVVMVTSSMEERDQARSSLLGVNSYVIKPNDIAQFIEVIKDVGQYWAVIKKPTLKACTQVHFNVLFMHPM